MIECGVVNKIWKRGPISFKHHITTKPLTNQNIKVQPRAVFKKQFRSIETHVIFRRHWTMFLNLINHFTLDNEHNWEDLYVLVSKSANIQFFRQSQLTQGRSNFESDFCWCFIVDFLLQHQIISREYLISRSSKENMKMGSNTTHIPLLMNQVTREGGDPLHPHTHTRASDPTNEAVLVGHKSVHSDYMWIHLFETLLAQYH